MYKPIFSKIILSTHQLKKNLGAPEMENIRRTMRERKISLGNQLAWVCTITAHAEEDTGLIQESSAENTYMNADEVC
jgi:hypothetical protein